MITIQLFNSSKRHNSTWLIYGLCGLNLLFMHYYIFYSCHLESVIDITSITDNFLGVIFDVSILILFFYFLSNQRTIFTSCTCFFITWTWSLSNIIYSRFFHHYITISAITQSDALINSVIFRSVVDSIELIDCYFTIIILLFFLLINKTHIKNEIFQIRKVFIIIISVFVFDLGIHLIYSISNSQTRSLEYYRYRIHTLHLNTHRNSLQPNFVHFTRGSFRTIAIELLSTIQGSVSLSKEQLSEIEAFTSNIQRGTISKENPIPNNLIFILVESYMSFVSDIKINGQEVTPFLNSLQRDTTIYYNGHMNENVTIGESSDGQLIYVTGLLPLRSSITITRAKDICLPGLPKIIARKSRMIIPTVASMWRQDEMCRQYGFDDLYTRDDIDEEHNDNLNDNQVFQLAMQKDHDYPDNFFSFIITMSMHQPYTEQIDTSFIIPSNEHISHELASYLNACHFTDQQIKKYFEHLKQNNLYDNSLIVITADHAVHCTDFGGVTKELPLYIINAKGLPLDNMWRHNCNQIDVYPTLLDLLGIECNWYGLGNSLLSPNYTGQIPMEKWLISEMIIKSDYFRSTN